jgi:HK97 gp10 family phage protein
MASKIQGLDRLRRKLKQMPEVIKEQIRQEMEKAAEQIVKMAKSLVPVDSGALRDSIGWTWGDPPGGAMVLAAAGDGDLRITIYAGTRDKKLGDMDAFYVRFVEFGTSKMSAHPFFYPSYRANKKRAASRIRRAINKAVKQVASS